MDNENNIISFYKKKYDSYPYVKFNKDEMMNAIDSVNNLSNLKHIGFCMITPDAIMRQLVPDILLILILQRKKKC